VSAGHLIHVGYPKTGSNFLRRWFDAHPELGFVNRGLAGFDSVYAVARQGASPDPRLGWRVTSAEALAAPDESVGRPRIDYGDERAVPMGEAQARVCATLASLFPSAHILVVTRGFRAMILSAYSQYVRTGGTESFEDFYRPGSNRAARWRETWDYDHLIALYRAAFPERVIVLPYELLRDDPAAFTRALAAPLGIAPCDPPVDRPNIGLSPVELAWYPRLTHFVRALPVGNRLRRRIEGRYLRAARANRLTRPVALLQRLRPRSPVGEDLLTDDLARSVWGRAESVRSDPLYAPYLGDYFL
jgi:hypothetical protein